MAAESDRTRELRELAERASAAALLEQRMRFHDRYGHFIKCSTCGGYGSRCGHLTPVEHSYSLPNELLDNSERIDAVLKAHGYEVVR